MDNDKIGKYISKKRLEAGLTQNELGDKLFVTGKAVSKWERGLSLPDVSILEKLADVLDTDIYEILQIKKKKNIDLEKIIDEERNKIKKYLRKKYYSMIIPIIIIFAIILFKLIPFGYYIDHVRYVHNTNKLIDLGMPKFSFNMKNIEDSYSYTNIRSKKVLESEVKSFLSSLEYISCYDTRYYYDENNDITVIDYGIKSNILYSTISYSIRNGNYCEIMKADDYSKKLNGLNKIFTLYFDDSKLDVTLSVRYDYSSLDDKFIGNLYVVYKDDGKTGSRVLENSVGIYEIVDNELIYYRNYILGDAKDKIPNVSKFILKSNKLILKENYFSEYEKDIILK